MTLMTAILQDYSVILLANNKKEGEKGIEHAQRRRGVEGSIEYGCG